ncbi:MAG: TonB family protein [Candidatus Krumholzibacteria bacterium]|nr:TonB family protein [Candidatus Krumholzibacteria bacterium]MDH4337269.1 TonB family protein [Candidatus Krumholzibacteria bacterium]MDH5270018.1 TonB family protein [Candidatus Krumholzibacteria bacterium]MDH5628320.1 TonB family protein [Candidatus Krumholzibacteria bacterium]
MPGRSWDNDSSYRRRLLAVLPLVILLLASLVYFTRRMAPVEIFKFVGWRGELELVPKITIIPDTPSPNTTPTESGQTTEGAIKLDLAEVPGDFEANPPRIQSENVKKLAPVFDDLSRVPAIKEPEREAAPYSDQFVILHQVDPRYPPRELAEGIEGTVTVELVVDEGGRVSDAYVLSALGPASFQESALEAVRQFEFQPLTDAKGQPTAMRVKFQIKFRVYG